MLVAERLTKIYRLPGEEIHALRGISLSVKEGEFVAIMGPSGAGKTTFLNLAGGLDLATGGTLTLAGQSWETSERRRARMRRHLVGFVFQEFFLLPQLTALENVLMPQMLGSGKVDRAYAEKLLVQVGLGARLHHRPSELSGGEMQRVAVARALANRPKVLLADEPTGNLDTKNGLALFRLFQDLCQNEGVTVVVATHNVRLAQLADRIILLREGQIERETKGVAA